VTQQRDREHATERRETPPPREPPPPDRIARLVEWARKGRIARLLDREETP
jgi:hypothetical protein